MDITTSYVILSWFYIGFTLCLVLNRLYQRALYRTNFTGMTVANSGDCLVVLAWLFNVAQCSCDLIIYVNKGFIGGSGTDPDTLSPKELVLYRLFKRVYYFENIIYYIPLFCIKGALLCFLMEITPPFLLGIRRALWTGVGITAVGLVFIEVSYVAACLPIPPGQYFFEHANDCKTGNIITSTGIALHMATDLYIYIIPFFLLRHLKLVETSKRLAAGAMFGAGFILVSLALPILIDSIPVGIVPHSKYTMWSFFWPLHEQNFAVFVACLPSLRTTVQRWKLSRPDRKKSKRKSMLAKVLRGELTTQEVVRSEYGDQEKFEMMERMESGKPVFSRGVMTEVSEVALA